MNRQKPRVRGRHGEQALDVVLAGAGDTCARPGHQLDGNGGGLSARLRRLSCRGQRCARHAHQRGSRPAGPWQGRRPVQADPGRLRPLPCLLRRWSGDRIAPPGPPRPLHAARRESLHDPIRRRLSALPQHGRGQRPGCREERRAQLDTGRRRRTRLPTRRTGSRPRTAKTPPLAGSFFFGCEWRGKPDLSQHRLGQYIADNLGSQLHQQDLAIDNDALVAVGDRRQSIFEIVGQRFLRDSRR